MKAVLANLGMLTTAGVLVLTLGPARAASPGEPAGGSATAAGAAAARPLPPLPENLPGWLDSKKRNAIFYKRGRFNFDIYNLKPLARDLNAVAVGHAMAYE